MEYLDISDLGKLFRVIYDSSKRSTASKNDHLIALIGFFTGARISQILSLKGEDVFQHGGRWVVKIHALKRGDDAVKDIHIDADLAFDMSPLIDLAARRRSSLLFPTASRSNFNDRLKKYCETAEIHSDFGHSHVLRHSAAMKIYDETERLGAVSHFLQHRSPATACCYLKENDGKRAQAVMNAVRFA